MISLHHDVSSCVGKYQFQQEEHVALNKSIHLFTPAVNVMIGLQGQICTCVEEWLVIAEHMSDIVSTCKQNEQRNGQVIADHKQSIDLFMAREGVYLY